MLTFEFDSSQVMSELCSAVASLLIEVKAGDRAADLVDKLKLDKSLAWHVAELANAANPLTVSSHVPGSEGIEILVKACAKKGASRAAVERLHLAFSRFKKLTADHAGDRQILDAMLASTAGVAADSKANDVARRNAYRANLAIFGVAAATYFHADLIAPHASGGDSLDICTFQGHTGLVRYNLSAGWNVSRASFSHDGSPADLTRAGPLDPESDRQFRAPLIGQFCTQPFPPFTENPEGGQRFSLYLDSGSIGLRGAIDVVTGEFARNIGYAYSTTPNDVAQLFARLYTPTEAFTHDILIHRDIMDNAWRKHQPRWLMYSALGNGLLFPVGTQRKPKIPTPPISYAGRATTAPPVPKVPRYVEMLNFACEKMSWKLNEFVIFRARLTYPPIPATSVLEIPLPMKSA
jgi:hypothetical protein